MRVPERVSLMLSGHTHGGQVRLFGWSPIVPEHYLLADTNFPDSTEEPEFGFGHVYQVTARSLLLFQLA